MADSTSTKSDQIVAEQRDIQGARTVRVAEVMDGAPAASPTRRASRLRMAVRTGIRFLCPFESTTRRSMC